VLSNHSNLKISIPLITFVLLTQYNLFYIINIVFYIFVTKYYTTVMLTTYTLKIITMLTRSLHTLVIFITSTNTSLQNTVLVLWEHINESVINIESIYTRSIYRSNILNENVYTLNTSVLLNSTDNLTSNSFFWFCTNLDTQFYQLQLSTNTLRQVIYNHTYLYSFKVSTWDNSVIPIDLIFTTLFTSFIIFYFLKIKIIF
jgi:hypothetical protein